MALVAEERVSFEMIIYITDKDEITMEYEIYKSDLNSNNYFHMNILKLLFYLFI